MDFEKKIVSVQQSLKEQKIDGWLLYDFRNSNDIATSFLEIPPTKMLTRRLWYWIPAEGEPVKLVHRVEADALDHLPGKKLEFHPWKEMEAKLQQILSGSSRVAMEYSARNAIPYVSKVDGGTIEQIRSFGVEVVSSAKIMQGFSSVLSEEQIQTHLYAANVVDQTVHEAWDFIREKTLAGSPVTDYDVHQLITQRFADAGCENDGGPIVAVNGDAADPHYTPTEQKPVPIRKGDWVLIDLWCRKKEETAIYADICRVGVVGEVATERQQELFEITKQARDRGISLVKERIEGNQPLEGWEVDQAVRDVIAQAGYEEFFTHRTGHNITTRDHGEGAHLDNLETQDDRELLTGTCFSIEPGIYLTGDIGIRLEVDVLITHEREVLITGGVQEEIECLLADSWRPVDEAVGKPL